MVNVRRVIGQMRKQPGYTLMRGVARFPMVRRIVAGTLASKNRGAFKSFLADCENRMEETVFPDVDRQRFLSDLNRDGLAFGLKLPAATVEDIRHFADENDCYADRAPQFGFNHKEILSAEAKLGKHILVAQYYNTLSHSSAIRKLAEDPMLNWVAAQYLRSRPVFFGSNLWWTFPTAASEEERSRHAHLFHRDVDDFKFFKFFFYLTDVPEGEGAHVCVSGSNHRPPEFSRGDRWNIRRYTDQEISSFYEPDSIHEICGEAGTGFAEDTLCIHKGSTPKSQPRLLLQLQFGLFNYGHMHDNIDEGKLGKIG